MSNTTKQKWTEDRVATLLSIVGTDTNTQVSVSNVTAASEALDVSAKSVAAKLRNLDYTVESLAVKTAPTFTQDEADTLAAFVTSHSGQYTFAEITAKVFAHNPDISPRQVQGKLLHLELTEHVAPSPKVDTPKKFTDAEEATIIQMASGGAFLEDIAEALGRSLNQIRGKCLAISRAVEGFSIPKQRESYAAAEKVDVISTITNIDSLTVQEIAEISGKSERGVRTILTHRGITCADHNGAKRREKLDAAKSEAA